MCLPRVGRGEVSKEGPDVSRLLQNEGEHWIMKPKFRISPRTCRRDTGTASVSRDSCKDFEERGSVAKGDGIYCLAVDGTLPAKARKLQSLDTLVVLGTSPSKAKDRLLF